MDTPRSAAKAITTAAEHEGPLLEAHIIEAFRRLQARGAIPGLRPPPGATTSGVELSDLRSGSSGSGSDGPPQSSEDGGGPAAQNGSARGDNG